MSQQGLLTPSAEAAIDRECDDLERELRITPDAERRLEARRRRYSAALERMARASIDDVGSLEAQARLRARMMGSAEAEADAQGADDGAAERHVVPRRDMGSPGVEVDPDLPEAEVALRVEWNSRSALERADMEYPTAPPLPIDTQGLAATLEADRPLLGGEVEEP